MPANLFFNNAEEAVYKVYDIFIRKGSVVLDIGANIGLHSYYLSRRFEHTTVYSFEPLPSNAAYIREVIRINKISNIHVIEKAVNDKSGTCYFDTAQNNHVGHISAKDSGLRVDAISLDDFITSNNILPAFIKVDVEGAEYSVLKGFRNSIETLLPVMMIELHNPEQSEMVSDYFHKISYTLFKLLDKKYARGEKLLLEIKDLGNGLPPDMNGQVVAIPSHLLHNYKDFIIS